MHDSLHQIINFVDVFLITQINLNYRIVIVESQFLKMQCHPNHNVEQLINLT